MECLLWASPSCRRQIQKWCGNLYCSSDFTARNLLHIILSTIRLLGGLQATCNAWLGSFWLQCDQNGTSRRVVDDKRRQRKLESLSFERKETCKAEKNNVRVHSVDYNGKICINPWYLARWTPLMSTRRFFLLTTKQRNCFMFYYGPKKLSNSRRRVTNQIRLPYQSYKSSCTLFTSNRK